MPRFAAPVPDPLPEPATSPAARATPAEPETAASPPAEPRRRLFPRQRKVGDSPQRTSDDPSGPDDGPRRGSTSTDRSWRRRWSAGGDPEELTAVIGGALALAISGVGLLLRRRARTVRQPNKRELDAFAEPLARIACRHFPMDLLGPDLLDITKAGKATSDYVTNGRLIVPAVTTGVLHTDRTDQP